MPQQITSFCKQWKAFLISSSWMDKFLESFMTHFFTLYILMMPDVRSADLQILFYLQAFLLCTQTTSLSNCFACSFHNFELIFLSHILKTSFKAYSRTLGQRSILARKSTKNFTSRPHPSLFNSFLSVLHRNKALYNFHKREQRSILDHNIGLEYTAFINPLVYSYINFGFFVSQTSSMVSGRAILRQF